MSSYPQTCAACLNLGVGELGGLFTVDKRDTVHTPCEI